MLVLFTVTVTAMVGGMIVDGEVLNALAGVLAMSGVLDAAATVDDQVLSFTGQVEAPNALAAVSQAATAMYLTGYTRITSVNAEPTEEEEDAYRNLNVVAL